MKKFMIAALFMLSMTATNSFACGPEITHNYYLFDVTAGDFKKNRKAGVFFGGITFILPMVIGTLMT